MSTFIKLLFLTSLVCSAYAAPSSRRRSKNSTEPVNCDKMLLETDKCVARVTMLTQKDFVVPTTADELIERYCKNIDNEVPCLRGFGTKCLKSLPRTLFNIGYKKAMEIHKRFCYTPEGQRQFLHHMQCMKPEYLSVLHQYLHMITGYLEYIERNVTANEIIPWSCCAYFKVSQEAEKQLHNYCDAVTGPDTPKFVMDLLKSFTYDLIDIGCGKYTTTEQCNTLLPEAMRVYEELGDVTKVVPKDYSPVVPAIGIIKRMDTE